MSCRSYKHAYSLLNGKATAADTPYSLVVDPVDTAVMQLDCKRLSGGSRIVRAGLSVISAVTEVIYKTWGEGARTWAERA